MPACKPRVSLKKVFSGSLGLIYCQFYSVIVAGILAETLVPHTVDKPEIYSQYEKEQLRLKELGEQCFI